MHTSLASAFLMATLSPIRAFTIDAFAASQTSTGVTGIEYHKVASAELDTLSYTRRKLLALIPMTIVPFTQVKTANSVVMEHRKEMVFEVGVALGGDEAKRRFREARTILNFLIDNYDAVSKEGGDNVRRYLGTVGTTSALYGITKVMKELQGEAKDIVEYTENMEDFEYYLRAADTAVYSANFVEFSAASTKPEKFFADAKSDCITMRLYLDKMAAELTLQ